MKRIARRGVVLQGGPGDHRPFVKDLWYTDRPDAPPIRVGFWNVHHGTNARQARPMFAQLVDELGIDLFIGNEIKRRSGILDLLRDDFGMRVRHAEPEFAIAAASDRFTVVRSRPLVMSEHDYWLERNMALAVVLHDRLADTRLKAISQHPPAHVVRKSHPTHHNVLAVHRDVAERNARIARQSTMPVLIGRDSNIDPRRDRPVHGGDWDWAYRGYDYIRSPEPTHGGPKHGRHIDELLTSGLSAAPPRGGSR